MPDRDPLSIGKAWIEAFNAHDVDALIALYADDATHTSPEIRTLHPQTGGEIVASRVYHG
jgi:ketosteroid isomerase-like protein